MKKFLKNKIWKVVCAFVLCAGISIWFVTCADEDECKECTFKDEDGNTLKTGTFCGDELTEARLTPRVTCK